MHTNIALVQRPVTRAYAITQHKYISTMTKELLRWQSGNAKLPSRILHFSLPSGHSCPAALECLSKADQDSGKITDGKQTKFRCYAATMEARHSAVRKLRWQNFLLLRGKSRKQMFRMLFASLKKTHDRYHKNHQQRPIIRSHVGGDFFNKSYFLAWMDLARAFNPTKFYAYTKRLDLWLKCINDIPNNYELNASRGGRFDHLIDKHNLKSAEVVFSYDEAKQKGLQIDCDDTLAYTPGPSFAQLLHGTQPAGSDAAKAKVKLQLEKGFYGYSNNT